MLTALTTSAPTALAAIAAAHAAGGPWAAGWGWLFFLIPLFWIALFALLFAFVGRRWRRAAWAADGSYGPPWARGAGPSAEQTLAERFAKGDIDEVEYRARLEVLRANRPNA
ncbi:SHOCT domain-containing protein [Agromyces silvae]|uniref:SHOCT domain-containing protein n=1 Tax=Agromyces silvae TaxID=3388266 RepID=UPI00280C21FB|nr:SHOCT domain-containing protein [Agromyces protaetiae]